jgi:hypothetical protein
VKAAIVAKSFPARQAASNVSPERKDSETASVLSTGIVAIPSNQNSNALTGAGEETDGCGGLGGTLK